MLLNLDKLDVETLNEKLNTLTNRMRHLEIAGSHGSNAYAQCLVWMQQINYELEERHYMSLIEEDPDWQPGLVAELGMAHLEEEDKKDGKD